MLIRIPKNARLFSRKPTPLDNDPERRTRVDLMERKEFIKASPAIQIQSKMMLLQHRTWNVLLANAYDELPHTDIHSVSMVELAAKLDFNSGNLAYLKETLEALVDCTVKWNILEKDKEVEWGVASSRSMLSFRI